MSVAPHQEYPPQGQPQPGISPQPHMVNNSTIINNTTAPDTVKNIVLSENNKIIINLYKPQVLNLL